MQCFLEMALEGKGKTVLISGEAGSGKTRLATEFLKKTKDEVTVFSGWCLSNAAIPYFPFVEAFESYSSTEGNFLPTEHQSLKLKKLLTRQSENDEYQNLGRQAWKDQTFATITRELLLQSEQKPVIVFIDDIHWADSASLSLLQYLARAISYERILLLATFRSEELNPQFDVQNQQLAEVLRVMRREDLYSEIKLSGLNHIEVGDIAESMLKGRVSQKLTNQLTIESSGNPLFIIESLKFLSEQRGLVKENDCWVTVNEKFGIPEKVRDVILRRLNSLSLDVRDVLDAGSVIGDKFDAELIGSVLGQRTVKVLSTLNAISKSESIVICENDWFRFDHPKTREVLYQEISAPLRKEYHLRIAETLENRLVKGTSFGDLAYHYVNSGNTQKAIKYSIEAGKDALARYSNAEAIKHFDWVIQKISINDESISDKQLALEGLGDAYYAKNLFKDAINAYEDLASISTDHIRHRALSKAMDSAFFMGDFKKVQNLVKTAESYRDYDRIEKARILHYKGAAINNLEGQWKDAFKLCEESLQIFEEEYALSDAAWRMFVVADFASSYGELERGAALALRSIALYDQMGDLRSKMEAYNEAGIVFENCALYAEAQKMFKKVLEIEKETKMGNYIMVAKANLHLSLHYELVGDLTNAINTNLEALENLKKADSNLFLGRLYTHLIRQYVKQNDQKQAEEYFDKITKMLPAITNSATFLHYALAKAMILMGRNQLEESINWFNQNHTIAKSKSANPVMLVLPLMQYVWVLNRAGRSEEANSTLKKISGIIQSAEARFQRANLQAYIMSPIKVKIGEPFEVRIDIINISRTPVQMIKLQYPLPSKIEAVDYPESCIYSNGIISFEHNNFEPFSVKTLTIRLLAREIGTYTHGPEIQYICDSKESKTYKPKPISITISPQSTSKEQKQTPAQESSQIIENPLVAQTDANFQFEFENSFAEKAFNFLIEAFIEDYMRRRLALEKAGWRTLMAIAEHEKLPKSKLYGSGDRKGKVFVELKKRGLIEARYFPGERGRGGQIMRIRVSYDKEIIKRQIDNRILKKE